MALNAASSSAALGKGTSSTGAQSSRLGPPGLHLPREQLLRARVALRQNELATDELHSPIKTVGHSNLLKDARKMKRHAAIHRDKEKLQRLESMLAERPQYIVVEPPGPPHADLVCCEVAIQTEESSVPFDVAKYFQAQVAEIKRVALDQVEAKYETILSTHVELQQTLEKSLLKLKGENCTLVEKLNHQMKEIESLQKILGENPRNLLLPDLDLSAASSEAVLIQQLEGKVDELVQLNVEICAAKKSFTSENSGLKAELSRLRHDNVILQDELSELKQQFSDDGDYCDD